MPLRRILFSLVAAALVLTLSAAYFFSAPTMADPPSITLSGRQEVPRVRTLATGTSTIAISSDGTVTGSVDVIGINGTGVDIDRGGAGEAGTMILALEQSTAQRWTVPAGSRLSPHIYQDYLQGDLYVNVHSEAHERGEIRLQLQPPDSVAARSQTKPTDGV